MSTGEVIHESETGGRKAGNLERYDQLPPAQLMEIAAFYATPYASYWIGEGGSFNELNAQLWKFWGGDDVDPETGYNRLVHIAFQALELLGTELVIRSTALPAQIPGQADTWLLFDLFDAEVLRLLALHYGRGALKYGDSNYQLGYNWDLSFAALNRHLWQHQSGQFLDEETGSPHLVAVVWHAITLLWFYENKPEFDTRTSTKQRIAEGEADWAWFEALPTEELADSLSFNDPFVEASWVDGFLKLAKELAADTTVPAQLIDELMTPIYQDTTLAALEFERKNKPKGPVYYVSGPMSGMPDHNFPAFAAKAAELRAEGKTVINPAELPGEGDEHPWEWFLRRDLIAMLEGGAEIIEMLPGWEQSRGAQLEHHVASALGFTIVYPDDSWYVQELDIQRNDSWVDALNDIVVDLDDAEGTE